MPISGIFFRCGLISAIRSQSAWPLKKSWAVRPWTVRAAPPADSTTFATSIARIESRVQPRRILAVTGVGAQAAATRSTIAPIRCGSFNRYDPLCARSATSAHRAAEVDIDDADFQLMGQLRADRGQALGIIVPNLHGQRPRFVGHAPQPIGQFPFRPFAAQEPLGANHLRRLQARPAEFANDLPIGVIRESGHRSLEDRRIDDDGADAERRMGHGKGNDQCLMSNDE